MPNPTYIQPGEILPPLSKSGPPSSTGLAVSIPSSSNEDLNYVATLLDDKFTIPGTGIRFGLDALIGWIPGLGDVLTALASSFIVFSAWRRGAQRITLIRMILNLSIESAIGAIPVLGDAAHVAWKANRRNYNLLLRDQHHTRRHPWHDWLFVVAAMLVMGAIFIAPWILLIYVLKAHRIF